MKSVLLILVLLVLALSMVGQTTQTVTVNNRKLQSSNFALIQGPSIRATTGGCTQGQFCFSDPVGILKSPWLVSCKAPVGKTCTYEITLTAPIFADASQPTGLAAGMVLTYAGDGIAFCNDTGSCGATQYWYVPVQNGPGVGGPVDIFRFVVQVKNTSNLQSHPIQINLQCTTGTTGVCSALLGSNAGENLEQTLGTLQTNVYTP